MKRILLICLAIILPVLFLYCIIPKSSVAGDDTVELILIYDEQDIHIILPDDEADQIRKAMNGNLFYLFPGTPACGFTKDYSFKIGNNFYAIAIDKCNTIMECESERYFDVSEEEINYIHSLFQKYDR